MCGLVGIFGNIGKQEKEAFNQMLLFDAVRGDDSTGVYIRGDAITDGTIIKSVGSPYELFDSKKYEKALSSLTPYHLLMGHNRAASRGAVTKANAHPFEFDKLVGTHNGTITNYYSLLTERCDTDSETIYSMINDKGVENVVPELLGSWALVWWDKEKNTLNFLRNSERPLFFTVTKDGKNLLYSSEKWMMEVAAQRSGIEINEPMEVLINQHYSFSRTDSSLQVHPLKEIKGKEITYTKITTTTTYPSSRTYGIKEYVGLEYSLESKGCYFDVSNQRYVHHLKADTAYYPELNGYRLKAYSESKTSKFIGEEDFIFKKTEYGECIFEFIEDQQKDEDKVYINNKPVHKDIFKKKVIENNDSCAYCGSPYQVNKIYIDKGSVYCSEECVQGGRNLLLPY